MLDTTTPRARSLSPHDAVVPEGHGLRGDGPLGRVVLDGGVQAWATGDYAVAREILTRRGDFLKNPANWRAYNAGEISEGWGLLKFITLSGMLNADGTDHDRLRGLVGKAFTPRRIEDLRPRVEEIVGTLIDDLESQAAPEARAVAEARVETGPVDLRQAFAFPLPMTLICDLFGLDASRSRQLADDFAVLHDGRRAQEVQAAEAGLGSVIGELIAVKSAAPGDDLTSALIAAHSEGEARLSEKELVETLLLFLFAGHETTANLIANAVLNLAGHPEQLAAARESGDWTAVVNETLRRDSPVRTVMFYYAARDVTLAGTEIAAGDPVVIHVAATGRDPRQFGPDADEFDVLREAADKHLGFSHGVHYCIGAPLARMMATTALRVLFDRFDVELTGAPEPVPSYSSNAPQTLPVRLTRRAGSRKR
ncbi:cytochrome P450 [Streptomyces sp. NPDC004732]|uniref:cytochrome P450 family protein n=1 Tax=Streptomyces sp. NPDC004732 TaxID=3154290 RepID=UPI0033A24F2B